MKQFYSFFSSRTQKILLVVFLLLILLNALLITQFLSKISIANNSKYYTLHYKPSKEYEKSLNEIDLLRSTKSPSSPRTKKLKPSATHIKIEITDKVVSKIGVETNDDPPVLQIGATGTFNKNSTYHLMIYINPTLSKTLSDEKLTELATWAILYAPLYGDLYTKSSEETILQLKEKYIKNPTQNPFQISKK